MDKKDFEIYVIAYHEVMYSRWILLLPYAIKRSGLDSTKHTLKIYHFENDENDNNYEPYTKLSDAKFHTHECPYKNNDNKYECDDKDGYSKFKDKLKDFQGNTFEFEYIIYNRDFNYDKVSTKLDKIFIFDFANISSSHPDNNQNRPKLDFQKGYSINIKGDDKIAHQIYFNYPSDPNWQDFLYQDGYARGFYIFKIDENDKVSTIIDDLINGKIGLKEKLSDEFNISIFALCKGILKNEDNHDKINNKSNLSLILKYFLYFKHYFPGELTGNENLYNFFELNHSDGIQMYKDVIKKDINSYKIYEKDSELKTFLQEKKIKLIIKPFDDKGTQEILLFSPCNRLTLMDENKLEKISKNELTNIKSKSDLEKNISILIEKYGEYIANGNNDFKDLFGGNKHPVDNKFKTFKK